MKGTQVQETRTNETFEAVADAGCVRIDTPDVAFYFSNGFGEGGFDVHVIYDGSFGAYDKPAYKFVEHFNIKTTATVSSYDCEDKPVHTLPEGKYGVYYTEDCDVYIVKWDY